LEPREHSVRSIGDRGAASTAGDFDLDGFLRPGDSKAAPDRDGDDVDCLASFSLLLELVWRACDLVSAEPKQGDGDLGCVLLLGTAASLCASGSDGVSSLTSVSHSLELDL